MIPGLPVAFDVEHHRVEDVFAFLKDRSISAETSKPLSPEEAWVQSELQYYEGFFTEQKELSVCVVTFNVACKKPPKNLASLITQRMPNENREPVDLIMIGLQEVDMSASAMLKEETEAATPWINGLHAAVGADVDRNSSAAYFALTPKQLVGLLLCVYIRRDLLPFVQETSIMTVATGALGSMGNKGAVGVHLVLHRTSICLINAHLAAGQNNLAKRNEDASSILMGMDFNSQKRQLALANVSTANGSSDVLFQYPEILPHNHDIIIVAGDLNYRMKLGYDAAVGLALRNEVDCLLQFDEFTAELSSPHSPWMGFVDLRPTFPPTYRYDLGTNIYDTSEKQRVPGYTDRIATWTKRKTHKKLVKLVSLQALQEVMSSDHKPVKALLRVPICCEVPEKKISVTNSLYQRVGEFGLDRTMSAKATITPVSLDFGVQQFHDCGKRQKLQIENTGECVAHVKILRQRNHDISEGAWLRVYPSSFSILPGETKEVVVECLLNPRCMRWMRAWRPYEGRGCLNLSSMLVVFVYCGPVLLVECRCILNPSVFGNSLENIALLGNEPCVKAYAETGNLEKMRKVMRPQLPKELWFLCEVIFKRGARVPDLFMDNGSNENCSAIMNHLDTCSDSLPEEFDVQCVATCLVTFLQSLQEPVVPFALYGAAIAAGRAKGKAPVLFVQNQLPPQHANIWVYVCALLNFLLCPVNARSNELNSSFLAKLFSEVMIVRPSVLLSSSLYGNKRTDALSSESCQGVVSIPQSGMTSPTLRQQIQQEQMDAMSLVEYFLVPPPEPQR